MQKSRHPDRRSASVRSQADTPPRQERRAGIRSPEDEITRTVRLTRKYADMIDGVDLSDAKVGDELNLSPHEADVLIAEGWAEHSGRRQSAGRRAGDVRSHASDTRPPEKRPKS